MENSLFWPNYYRLSLHNDTKAEKQYIKWLKENPDAVPKQLSQMKRERQFAKDHFVQECLETMVNILIDYPEKINNIPGMEFAWLTESLDASFWQKGKNIEISKLIIQDIIQQPADKKSLHKLSHIRDTISKEQNEEFQNLCENLFAKEKELIKDYSFSLLYKLVPNWKSIISLTEHIPPGEVCDAINLTHYFGVELHQCKDVEAAKAISESENNIKSITPEEIRPLFKRFLAVNESERANYEHPPIAWAILGRKDLAEEWVSQGGKIDRKSDKHILQSELWSEIIHNRTSKDFFDSIKHLANEEELKPTVSTTDWRKIWNSRLGSYNFLAKQRPQDRKDNPYELTPLLSVFAELQIRPPFPWFIHSVRLGRLDWANQLIDMGVPVDKKDAKGNNIWHVLLSPQFRFTPKNRSEYSNYMSEHAFQVGSDYQGVPRLSGSSNKDIYRVFRGKPLTAFYKTIYTKAAHLLEEPNRKGVLPITSVEAAILKQDTTCGVPTPEKELYKIFSLINNPSKTGKNLEGQNISQAEYLSKTLSVDEFSAIERGWLAKNIHSTTIKKHQKPDIFAL